MFSLNDIFIDIILWLLLFLWLPIITLYIDIVYCSIVVPAAWFDTASLFMIVIMVMHDSLMKSR